VNKVCCVVSSQQTQVDIVVTENTQFIRHLKNRSE